jgi:uncharacterized protein
MKLLKFLLLGIAFGIIMTKSEAISWYRIQEMFHFRSFHMYGIIVVSVILGMIAMTLIKKYKLKDVTGHLIAPAPKSKSVIRYIVGGTLFGMGWAITGACPGPIVVNIGYGFLSFIVVFIFAIAGTWLYGMLQEKLPQ